MDLYTILQQQEQLRMHAAAKHMKTNAVTHTEKNSGNNKGGRKKPGKKPGKNQGKKPEKKQSKKIPKGSVCKKDNKKPRGKTQSTKALKGDDSTLYSLPKKSKEDKDVKKPTQVKKKTGKTSIQKVALLVAGAGNGSDTFRNDVEQMKRLFSSDKLGISEQKMFTVVPGNVKEASTKSIIKNALKKAIQELKKSENSQFIFYYCGHFDKNHRFLIDDKDDKYYLDEDLARELQEIPAKYMLLMLSMCYSGSAAFRTKGHGSSESSKGEKAPVPRLWKILEPTTRGRTKGPGETTPVTEKVIQWSSSFPEEKTYFLKAEKRTFFGNAIIEVLDDVRKLREEIGPEQAYVTVRHMNNHVNEHMKRALSKYQVVQRSMIKPDYADDEYFKSYPFFAKVK